MAKISKKRFSEICQEHGVDPKVLHQGTVLGHLYAELNKSKNKWIPWAGGKCPVTPDTLVDTKFQDGNIFKNLFADNWDWEHAWGPDNIIAYKVVDNS